MDTAPHGRAHVRQTLHYFLPLSLLLIAQDGWAILATPSPSPNGSYVVEWENPTGCTYPLAGVVECHTLEERSGNNGWSGVLLPSGSTSYTASGRGAGTYEYRITHTHGGPAGTTSTVVAGPTAVSVAHADGVLFRQNFEALPIGSNWYGNRRLSVIAYETDDGERKVLQATYVPTSRGSARLVRHFPFVLDEAIEAATLSFDMKLDEGFEFVKGGKMHGLGGGTATTGCHPIDPEGWSVRMMWNSRGAPFMYIYHQDRARPCGDTYALQSEFTFELDRWYRVEIYVEMNAAPGTADGRATLYIDGDQLIDVTNLNLSGDSSVKIDQFLFNTFHGGSDPTWSPSTDVRVYFDNFTVYPGRLIAGTAGTACEVFEGGIYDPLSTVCCAQSCGACGGASCGFFPGGESSCCTQPILASGRWCPASDTSAPCAFFDSPPLSQLITQRQRPEPPILERISGGS